jgi:outer membrane lipoprotein SlyB
MEALRCVACITTLTVVAVPAAASLLMVGPMEMGSIMSRNVLSIQNEGTASGCVGFFGGADITGLAACPGAFTGSGGNELIGATATATVGDLHSLGVNNASDLELFVRSGEPAGTPLQLTDLALIFFDVTAGSTFTATLAGTPLAIPVAATGNTQLVFKLDSFEASLANEFMSAGNNRVGAAATISGSTGSVNSFLLSAHMPVVVPEPGVMALAGSGLITFARLKKRRGDRRRADRNRKSAKSQLN